jgi:hypothetical protein
MFEPVTKRTDAYQQYGRFDEINSFNINTLRLHIFCLFLSIVATWKESTATVNLGSSSANTPDSSRFANLQVYLCKTTDSPLD